MPLAAAKFTSDVARREIGLPRLRGGVGAGRIRPDRVRLHGVFRRDAAEVLDAGWRGPASVVRRRLRWRRRRESPRRRSARPGSWPAMARSRARAVAVATATCRRRNEPPPPATAAATPASTAGGQQCAQTQKKPAPDQHARHREKTQKVLEILPWTHPAATVSSSSILPGRPGPGQSGHPHPVATSRIMRAVPNYHFLRRRPEHRSHRHVRLVTFDGDLKFRQRRAW